MADVKKLHVAGSLRGASAYEIAVSNGFTGTEPEWLASLQGENGEPGYTPVKGVDYFDGKDGAPGKDGYTPQKGVDYFDGNDGEPGKDGEQGEPGKDGSTPYIGENGNWWIAGTDTGVSASGGGGGVSESATDEDVLAMLSGLDILPAATSDGAILTDENGAILLW